MPYILGRNGDTAMTNPNQADPAPTTVYCTRCGKPMSIASEHMRSTVACPHCSLMIDPWRVAQAAHAGHAQAGHSPGGGAPGTVPPTAPPPAGYAPGAPYGAQYPGQYSGPVSTRSKVVAGVLGILLGGLGVHRFYLGYIGIGLIQILVFVVTFGMGGIWGFIEGILCLTGSMRDVDGLPLRD